MNFSADYSFDYCGQPITVHSGQCHGVPFSAQQRYSFVSHLVKYGFDIGGPLMTEPSILVIMLAYGYERLFLKYVLRAYAGGSLTSIVLNQTLIMKKYKLAEFLLKCDCRSDDESFSIACCSDDAFELLKKYNRRPSDEFIFIAIHEHSLDMCEWILRGRTPTPIMREEAIKYGFQPFLEID